MGPINLPSSAIGVLAIYLPGAWPGYQPQSRGNITHFTTQTPVGRSRTCTYNIPVGEMFILKVALLGRGQIQPWETVQQAQTSSSLTPKCH